ncbi:hypothetical protein Tco_0653603 [Tanacetum coccineum]|uniref:Uncharacterized protein n=1 Tax=Tanacetum coccineum TaxID=301880 RepID=A0ABQ4X0W6_9ASTR
MGRLGFVFVYSELAKTAALKEFEKSNDEEAVMLSASRATSTVVDAANATEVSRNHSGSVDEILKIRNPRQIKRFGSSSSQIENPCQSIALPSTLTRSDLSAIVNYLFNPLSQQLNADWNADSKALEEFEKSNDEEAVVLSASRATSTVVDATNATNVSTLNELVRMSLEDELHLPVVMQPMLPEFREVIYPWNHSGSVDEISNIRNPRKMKRLRSSSYQIANPWQSIALRSTFTRRGLSAIEKTVEIEYIRAVAPHKEENPSLHDDWVSAVDGLSQ